MTPRRASPRFPCPARVLFFFGVIVPILAQGALLEDPSGGPSSVRDNLSPRISHGVTLAPIVGFDPSLGVILGGAVFRGNLAPPASQWEVILYGTHRGKLAAELAYKIWAADHWIYRVGLDTNNLPDSYYGEGNDTRTEDGIRIDRNKVLLEPSISYRWTRDLSLGFHGELRYREERAVGGDSSRRLFGNELTPVVGASLTWDGRDHEIDTHRGGFYQLRLDLGPGLTDGHRFARLQVETRQFTRAASWLVLAGQFAAGAAFGDPGFSYRFRLGGQRRLRGYGDNRLRGTGYYLLQGESRLLLARWLSVVAFTGVGDAADAKPSDFAVPKLTGGVGLRVGLPPDLIAKARLDIGFAADEYAVFLNFNEVF